MATSKTRKRAPAVDAKRAKAGSARKAVKKAAVRASVAKAAAQQAKTADVVKPAVVKPTVVKPAKAIPTVGKTIVAALPDPVPVPATAPVAEVIAAALAAAEPIIETLTKGPDMATTTETIKNNGAAATDRVQAIFGDVNVRAKTAIEKSAKLYEEMTEFTKGNVEAIVASGRVAAKGAETLGQEAAEYGKTSFERASATFRSFAGAKSPTELFQLQSEFARTSFDTMVAESSKLSESFLKLAGDIAQPLSSRIALAAEKVKSAAAF